MLLRNLVLVGCTGIFLSGLVSAGHDEDKENLCPNTFINKKQNVPSTPSKSRKNKVLLEKDASPPRKFSKKESDSAETHQVTTFQHSLDLSPVSKEQEYFNIFRGLLVKREYENGEKKIAVPSPEVREIYAKNDPGNYFSGFHKIEGRTIHKVDGLFDSKALVLNKKGVWEDNLTRMKKGKAPICYKGIASIEERSSLTANEIRKKQKRYQIELNHKFQEDSEKCPLDEMTHEGHMGKNSRFIILPGSETKEVMILHAGLDKEAALKFLDALKAMGINGKMVTDTLHFRKGKSKVNRPDFKILRELHWKLRAKEIEAKIETGPFTPQPPKNPVQKALFQNMR